MSTKPSIVIVHGSWLNPSFYGKLVDQLIALGYPTSCPALPSCSPSATVDTSLIDDALTVRGTLTRLVEYEARSVILLMHSYGGLVGSEALPESLTSSFRQKSGLAGGVQHLIYLAGFMLPVGQSVQSFYGDMKTLVKDGFFNASDPKTRMFADMSSDEADVWVSRLTRQSFKVQETVTTRAAYTFTPSTYIILEHDRSVPPPMQERFAAAMKAEIVKCEIQAGHMACLTKPVELGNAIENVIQSVA